jgi:predicted  nucleic acid-binding Zn-ribbon protein
MARKDPKDLTVEEKLKALFQLQTTLSQIDEKRALRGELPLEVEDLENEVEGLSVRLDRINQETEDLTNAVSQRKADIEEAKASLDRYNQQLNDVKNNREYDTLTKEIDFQKLEIELCEKKIREAEQRINDNKENRSRVEEMINERERDLEDKRNELDEIMQETREEEDILKAKAKDTELKIESRLLSSFKRIRKNARNGLGIVYVQRDACGGCFNKIPPQRQLDVKMHKKIIVCEHCGRILIDPELAGVKIETPTTEKPKRKRTPRKKAEENTED